MKIMTRKLAGINEIERLMGELTLMGGDPSGLSGILDEFEFTETILRMAIDSVMSNHISATTYNNALACKRIMMYEIMVLNKSAIKL